MAAKKLPPFSWQTLLFVVAISLLFFYFLVAWHGDVEKGPLVQTFLNMWLVESTIFMSVFVLGWLKRDLLPFGRFPRDMNLALALVVGFGGAWLMIGVTVFITKNLGGMALLTLPEFWADIASLFTRLSLPKVQFRLPMLDVVSGLQAFFWQAVVSGVEEAMNVAFTLALSLILYGILLYLKKDASQISSTQKHLILAISVLVIGLTWTLMHGLKNYTHISEYLSAFAGRFLMALVTFATGSIVPAFLMHWWFNIFAPAVTVALIHALLFLVAVRFFF